MENIAKKAMFIVPHPDDEVMVGNYLLCSLVKNPNYDVCVVICTNGDFIPYEGEIRLRESIRALSRIGFQEEKIKFLGYEDSGLKILSHYHNELSNNDASNKNDERQEANGLDNYMEYYFQRYGIHHKLGDNLKTDLKDCIEQYYPDIIVSVDYDPHSDHREVSLLFEEALGKL